MILKTYKVIVTPDAETDLTEIRNYIAEILLMPETARQYLKDLKEAMAELSHMGASVAPVSDEPWHSRGVRKIRRNNFYIDFRDNDPTGVIFIMNVIYIGRDQLNALKHSKADNR